MSSPEGPSRPGQAEGVGESIDQLWDAIERRAWLEAGELASQISGQIRENSLGSAEPEDDVRLAENLLEELWSRGHKRTALEFGEAVLGWIQDSPRIGHLAALCILDLGEDPGRAEDLLGPIRVKLRADVDAAGASPLAVAAAVKALADIEGAVGRVYKARYLALPAGRRLKADLIKAISYYKDAYNQTSWSYFDAKSFVGINTASLLWLAARDKVDLGGKLGIPDALASAMELAREILTAASERGHELESWDFATLAECHLVLSAVSTNADSAVNRIKEFILVARRGELQSTRRQLGTIYGGTEHSTRPEIATSIKLAAELVRLLDDAIAEPTSGDWIVPIGSEVVINIPADIPSGEVRYGVLISARVDDSEGGEERDFLVTSGDVAWHKEVTCQIDTKQGKRDVAIRPQEAVLWASSPWCLDVTVVDLRKTSLATINTELFNIQRVGLPVSDYPQDTTVTPSEMRTRDVVRGSWGRVEVSAVRTDGRYLRYAPDKNAAPAPGAAVFDDAGQVCGIQRSVTVRARRGTEEADEREAALWSAVLEGIRGSLAHSRAEAKSP